LDAAHTVGLIDRDLELSNILIDWAWPAPPVRPD
jgi:hypothetical protein